MTYFASLPGTRSPLDAKVETLSQAVSIIVRDNKSGHPKWGDARQPGRMLPRLLGMFGRSGLVSRVDSDLGGKT